MKEKNCYGYIRIGLALRFLINSNYTYQKNNIKKHLDILVKELQEASFEVSLSYMRAESYNDLVTSIEGLESDSTQIGDEIHNDLSSEIKSLENTVFAEALTKNIYIIPQRRFNSNYLLDSPENFFKKGNYAKISDIARSDISSSGRCLLFGESTASAFHILRATEDVLKSYYFHYRKYKRLKKPMWGPMLIQLRAIQRNKPSAALLTSLDFIRETHRNPTQHPDMLYDLDSVQDLFGVCIDSIGKMAQEL